MYSLNSIYFNTAYYVLSSLLDFSTTIYWTISFWDMSHVFRCQKILLIFQTIHTLFFREFLWVEGYLIALSCYFKPHNWRGSSIFLQGKSNNNFWWLHRQIEYCFPDKNMEVIFYYINNTQPTSINLPLGTLNIFKGFCQKLRIQTE